MSGVCNEAVVAMQEDSARATNWECASALTTAAHLGCLIHISRRKAEKAEKVNNICSPRAISSNTYLTGRERVNRITRRPVAQAVACMIGMPTFSCRQEMNWMCSDGGKWRGRHRNWWRWSIYRRRDNTRLDDGRRGQRVRNCNRHRWFRRSNNWRRSCNMPTFHLTRDLLLDDKNHVHGDHTQQVGAQQHDEQEDGRVGDHVQRTIHVTSLVIVGGHEAAVNEIAIYRRDFTYGNTSDLLRLQGHNSRRQRGNHGSSALHLEAIATATKERQQDCCIHDLRERIRDLCPSRQDSTTRQTAKTANTDTARAQIATGMNTFCCDPL